MSDISVEKKMELMKQIRARNEQNLFDMSRREQILYGRSYISAGSEPAWDNTVEEDEKELQTFPLRILLALALFLMIIICDMSDKGFMGIKSQECFDAIAVDYESSISAWVDAASDKVPFEISSENAEKNPPAASRP